MSVSLKQRTLGAIIWKFAERGTYQIISFIVQIILARLLAPNEFGAMAIMQVFIALSNVLVNSGISNALLQAKEVRERDYTEVLNLSFLMALLLYMIIFFLSPIIAEFYLMPELLIELRILGLLVFINAFQSVQVARVTRSLKTKSLLKATLIGGIFSGFAAIVTALIISGSWALVVQSVTLQLTCCVALTCIEKWIPRLGIGIKRAMRFWQFGWKIAVSGIVYNAYQNIFDLVIGKVYSANILGLFSQGRKIPFLICNSIDSSIQSVMLSTLSRFQDNYEQLVRAMRRVIKTGILIISPIMLFIAASSDCLVPFVFGEQWTPCAPIMAAFAVGYSLSTVSSTNQQAINAIGRSDIFLRLEIGKAIIGLVVFFLAIVLIDDVVAIAWITAINLLLATFINSIPTKVILGYGYGEQIRDIAPTFGLAAVSSFVAFSIGIHIPDIGISLFVRLIVMFALYVLLLLSTKNEAAYYVWAYSKKFLQRSKSDASNG